MINLNFRTRMLLLAIADDWKYIAKDERNNATKTPTISVFNSKPYKENGYWMPSSSAVEIQDLLEKDDLFQLDSNICYEIADLIK